MAVSLRVSSATCSAALTPVVSTSIWRSPKARIRAARRQNSLGVRCAVVSEGTGDSSTRQLWLPGITPPSILDGSLAGDVGFDPLSLAVDEESLRWYVQAELIHARFAMLGVAGVIFTDLLRETGLKPLPVWYEAGAAHYAIASAPTLFWVQLILFAFVESKRYADFKHPGSQGSEDVFFFFIEPALKGTDNGYPGGPLFNPLGLAPDATSGRKLREQELANGRLAMVAAAGLAVQAAVTHVGPIQNLLVHLSDPWHNTIVKTLIDSLP